MSLNCILDQKFISYLYPKQARWDTVEGESISKLHVSSEPPTSEPNGRNAAVYSHSERSSGGSWGEEQQSAGRLALV